MPPRSSKTSAPSLVVFDINSSTPTANSALTSWQNGPQKLTGFERRGRPKKERKAPVGSASSKESQMTKTLSTFDFVAYTGLPHDAAPSSRKIIRRRAMLDFREKERRRGNGRREEDSLRQDRLSEEGIIQIAWGSSVRKLFLQEIVETDPFDAFGAKIEPYVLNLLISYSTMVFETQYTIEKYTNVNPVKDCWLPMAFREPALLHAIIFCAAIVNSVHQNVRESRIAVTHLRQAITIVNESLQVPSVIISDAMIVVVCALAQTEKMNGNHGNWKIHMLGLQQMVRVRGGLKAFDESPLVQNKIHRADLCGSIDAFEEPHFEPPKYSLASSDTQYSADILQSSFSTFTQLDERLSWILPRIQDVTTCLNLVHLHQTPVHPTTLREAITSLQYALLLKPINETPLQETIRLCLTIYLVTILNEFPRGASTFAMLGEKLISTLEEVNVKEDLEPEFVLWMMFMAASIMDKREIIDYFLAGAVDAMQVLHVCSWEDIEIIFRSFFWAEKIHAESFGIVWRELSR